MYKDYLKKHHSADNYPTKSDVQELVDALQISNRLLREMGFDPKSNTVQHNENLIKKFN